MPNLMATAEYVTKVHAVCTHTGNLAQYSHRKSKNDSLVLLGETDEYEPLSRAAYFKALTKEKLQDMDVVNPIDLDVTKNSSNG
jgi:thymidine kinase